MHRLSKAKGTTKKTPFSRAVKCIRCYPALQLIQPGQDYSDEMLSSKERLHLGVVISKNSTHCFVNVGGWGRMGGARFSNPTLFN